jgi:large subunit ribosomal protein L15
MHGWGRSGQHRGSGAQGGHGNAGWKRHRWSAVIRYGIQIGEPGFKSINHRYARTINLVDLKQRLDNLVKAGHAKQANGRLEVDLDRAGYTKLLSEGRIDQPLKIIVNQWSEKASEKVSKAGGELVSLVKGKEA